MKMKIVHIVGARPNFMKIAPIMRELDRYPEIDQKLVHTGQHYDEKMSRIFFGDLGLPKPDVDLEVGSGTHAKQTGRIMAAFEEILVCEPPDLLVVVGDVNSSLACTLTAAKHLVPVAHVEAGLRSFDRQMPEEINRLVTDVLSELLFTTSPEAADNLQREGIPAGKIFFVGNPMIDSLLRFKEKASASDILERVGQTAKGYGLVTLHRPSNVDDEATFSGIMKALAELSGEVPLLFPVHPRTRRSIAALGVKASQKPSKKGIHLLEPLGYLDFMKLMMSARLVLTDSGGIQEETSILNVPCITIRENTERPITLEKGTNHLVGVSPERILSTALSVLEQGPQAAVCIDLWDGKAAERIVPVIMDWFRKRSAGC